MKTTLLKLLVVIAVLALGAFSAPGLIPDDADGDGVPDSVDVCPGEDASGFDRNADGCVDAFVGARHIEYWSVEDAAVDYVINDQGVPSINDGSDLAAVQDAFDSWMSIPNTDLNFVFDGTTTQTNSNGLDRVNLVTFVDNAYPFSNLVLAVGLSTSFEADTLIDGRVFKKGEIFDADIVFNPTRTFKVGGSGSGSDVQSVATHEAGHVFGISHTAIQSSTMFYVLPGGNAARSLETDDELVFFKAYGTAIALAAANRLDVDVRDGQSNDPAPGAIVFVIDAANQDTVGCDYTLQSGRATFPGLADGSYYVSIYPLNGTSTIGFIAPGNINVLVAEIATENFVAESYDASESNKDDPSARTPVAVAGGSAAAVGIFTNIDSTPPSVVSAIPAEGATNVAIDGAYRVQFSEPIDVATLSGAFSFRDDLSSTAHAGNLAILLDDSVVVFIPSPPLAFATDYTLTFDTDLEDQFGNAMGEDFQLHVTTELEPPLSISSLAPSKGVVGTTVVINGQGFEPGASVVFGNIPATVISTSDRRIVTSAPATATSGLVTVTNPDLSQSNNLTFTVLSQAEVARGYESGQVLFSSTPKAIALTPDGDYAYVATTNGAQAIVVNSSFSDYLLPTSIPVTLGLDDVAAAPSGKRVYGISNGGSTLVEIMSDPTTGLLFNTILSTRPMGTHPRSIVVDPAGDHAYITTDEAEVHVWDIRLGSPTYRQHIGTITPSSGAGVTGAMAMTPAGDRLMFATDAGELVFYDPAAQAIVATVDVGLDPRSIVADPLGERAYVTHDNGEISVVNLQGFPFEVEDISTGGSLRGLAITPGASYIYSSDRTFDNLKVVDLVLTNATFRSVVAEIPAVTDPVDVAISPDGIYAFSVMQGSPGDGIGPRMLVSTIGLGPTLTHIHPIAGATGTVVVLNGSDFGQSTTDATVNVNGILIPNAGSGLDGEIVFTVPGGATSGPVTVEVAQTDGSIRISNPVQFQVTPPSVGGLRFAATLEPNTSTGEQMVDDLAMSPKGDVVFARFSSQSVQAYDIRPASTAFHRSVRTFTLGNVVDMAVTADGKTCFFYVFGAGGGNQMLALVSDPHDPNFCKLRPVSVTGFGAGGGFVRTSPNNRHAIVFDNELNDIVLVDATDVSQDVNPTHGEGLGMAGSVVDLAFHPSGRAAYVLIANPHGIQVLDTDQRSPGFGTAVDFSPIPPSPSARLPLSLDVSPNGLEVSVYTLEGITSGFLHIHQYPVVSPGLTLGAGVTTEVGVDLGSTFYGDIRVSPRGDRAVRSGINGFFQYALNDPASPLSIAGFEENYLPNDFEFTPDGNRMYVASQFHDHIREFDFATAAAISVVSGDNQTGLGGDVLAAPIRVRVVDLLGAAGAQGTPGVPVTFLAGGGQGLFEIPCDGGTCLVNELVVPTDADGFAQASWWLFPGVGVRTVEATAEGVSGSPAVFNATAVADPSTLPLTVAEVIPLDNSSNVSVSTAALVTFSREIEPSSIDASSLFIQTAVDATQVPVAFGFTDGNRRVSLTPLLPLVPNTQYQIVSTADIEAGTGGVALSNPGTTGFETQAPPPLSIASIAPPSALPGTRVTIAGSGFAAGPNTVNFGGVSVTGLGSSVALIATVPINAALGTVNVTVVGGAGNSNALPFNVLTASTTVIDEVIANIGTGSSAKSVVISADGALCYSVSTEGDVVVPVDVEGLTTFPSISVGDQPVAIVIDPAGTLAYVANFNSGTVSVIDADPASPTFLTVVETIAVGINPIDVAVAPDGTRLAVANAGSNDVSLVDTDETSATFNQVVSTITSGSSAKSVVISADGTLYIGTATGVLVVDASNNVVANVASGSAKSIVISADGTLLFVLTTDGEVLVIDIQDDSASENQVVATIGAGSSAKSIVISADGTLLYIVQEDTDEVLVLAIEIIPGVGASNPDGAGSFTIQTRVVGTLHTGDDPADVAVDPSGSGRVIVANAGDKTIMVFGEAFAPTEAYFKIVPGVIIPKLPGFYVLGVLQVPAPLSVHDIDISTVRVFDTVHVSPGAFFFGDVTHDGVDDLSVLFCRDEFMAAMPENGEFVDVVAKGEVSGDDFEGHDTIRVLRPSISKPEENERLMAGEPYTFRWTTPLQVLPCDQVKIEWRRNGDDADDVDCSFHGSSEADRVAANDMDELRQLQESADQIDDNWILIANHVANDGDYTWQVPLEYAPNARLRITLLWFGLKVGSSEVPFRIEMTVPVRLKSFDVTMEDGSAVLRWETSLEVGMEGYQIVRSEQETGRYDAVTKDVVPSSGQASGASYEYRDETVSANRTYWYKLREVAEDGLGAEYGPYSVTYRISNQLDQNVPNPFNPTTTIRYAIASDAQVNVTIYDVAGRRVRTLVNERQKADVHRVAWDGVNDTGQRVASGVYFYKLVAGSYSQAKKMLLLK